MVEQGGDLDQAMTFAQRAKKIAPDLPQISDTIGWIYDKQGKYDQAAASFRDLTRKQPENAVFHYHYAWTLMRLDDRSGALKEIDAALQLGLSSEDRRLIQELKTALLNPR